MTLLVLATWTFEVNPTKQLSKKLYIKTHLLPGAVLQFILIYQRTSSVNLLKLVTRVVTNPLGLSCYLICSVNLPYICFTHFVIDIKGSFKVISLMLTKIVRYCQKVPPKVIGTKYNTVVCCYLMCDTSTISQKCRIFSTCFPEKMCNVERELNPVTSLPCQFFIQFPK